MQMAFKSNLLYAPIALAGMTEKWLHLKSGQQCKIWAWDFHDNEFRSLQKKFSLKSTDTGCVEAI